MEPAILIFIVEDEEAIAHILELELSDGGFGVHVVRDGREAIAELERDAARFRALLTDVNLGPGPNGWEVAHRARELSPEIGVIYMTGGNAHEWRANGVPQSALLQKPFAAAQMLTAVTTLLNASGGNAAG